MHASMSTVQFGNQYLSIGTHLPRGYFIYGLGERKAHFRLTPGLVVYCFLENA